MNREVTYEEQVYALSILYQTIRLKMYQSIMVRYITIVHKMSEVMTLLWYNYT